MSICLSIRISKQLHGQTPPDLFVSVTTSGSVRYVNAIYFDPVLRMTVCFHLMGHSARHMKLLRHFYQILLGDKDQQVLIVVCAQESKSAIYDYLVVYVIVFDLKNGQIH